MAIVGLGGEKLWLCPSLNDNPHDISGNGNNGTYNGGMGTVADVSKGGKRAYSFDGVDDYIDLSLPSAIGNTFSVSLWIYFDAATASTNETFISNDGWRGGGWLAQKHSTASFRYAEQGVQPFLDNTGITVNTTWMHLVVVREAGGTVRQYKNGVQLSNTISTFASSITRTIVNIGRRYDIASQYLDGRMDDIRIFDRPLTTAEIKHLAKARGITGTPLKKGLGDEKLWLCPSIDDSAEDLSGNGNNGTYYNGLTTVADVSNGGTRAYLLDGINKRIECPASAIGSEPIISVSCWGYVNVHDSIFGEGLVSQFGAGTDSTKCKFVVNASNGGSSSIFPAVGIRPSTTNVSAVSTNAISAQSWHHFCLVADGSTIYNYVDGVLQASTAYTGSVRSVTNPFVIGTYNQLINSNHYLDGRIDDVRAFNRALTPTEITHLASTRGVAGSPYGFKGLGGEKLWLCPTLDDSAEDISGNRNHGTYNGGMSTVSDTASGGSRAYSFDGSNDYIDCGAASTIHSNSVFTYSIWIKASSNTGTTVGVFGAYDHTTGDRGALFAVGNNFSNKGAFYYQSVGSTYNSNELLQSTVNVVDGTWHHIVCVFDGVNGRALFYRDGTLVGNTASNVPSTVNQSTDFLVGRGAAANFSGYVDDARIFDRALTQEEVTHLAKSRGVLGSPHNLNGIVHLLSSFIHPFT